jgi:hypothetical protein
MSGVYPEPCEAITDNPAGESSDGALTLDFDRRLELEFHRLSCVPDQTKGGLCLGEGQIDMPGKQ